VSQDFITRSGSVKNHCQLQRQEIPQGRSGVETIATAI
jgi:hypothetical protein